MNKKYTKEEADEVCCDECGALLGYCVGGDINCTYWRCDNCIKE